MNTLARHILMQILLLLLTCILMVVLLIEVFTAKEGPTYVDRKTLLASVEQAIANGAALEDVKQVFENRRHVSRDLLQALVFWRRLYDDSETYQEPVSLTTVLKDLRANLYLRKEVNTTLANQITTKLAEHERRNPFDKLESNQRIHFEAVQSKLAEDYARIQSDINRVVDELAAKNELVTKYLGDATLSFRISVIALVIGVFAFIPQLVSLWSWWKGKTASGSSNGL